MAFGMELFVRLDIGALGALAGRMRVRVDDPTTTPYDPDRYDEFAAQVGSLAATVGPTLQAVHLELVRAHIDPNASFDGRYVHARTPLGARTLIPFALETNFDPYEIGGSWPDDLVVGIALTARYKPTFVDWREPHGAPNVIAAAGRGAELVEAAVTAIAAAVPEFAGAQLAAVLRWY